LHRYKKKKMSKICSPSGLQPFFSDVSTGDLVHDDEGAEGRAVRRQVPGVAADGRGEPRGAEPEEQAAAAKRVGDESGGCVVAFKFGEGPAFG